MKGRHLRGLFHRNSSQTEPRSPSPAPTFLLPPPYSRGNNVSPVVVRLRVWHIHELGWHPQFNDQLAKLLRDDVPKDWVARPAPKPQYNDSSGRDIFVPVEVEFEHQPLMYDAVDKHDTLIADVRDLFYIRVPWSIYQFFADIGTVPHIMDIHPINMPANMAEGHREKIENNCKHLKPLYQLPLRVQEFIVPERIKRDCDGLKRILQTGSEVASVLSSMVSIICLDKMKSPKDLFAGKTFKQVVSHLELELGPLEALDATKEIIQLLEKKFPEPDHAVIAEKTAATLNPVLPFHRNFRGALRQVQMRFPVLDSDLNTALSRVGNEDIYLSVICLRQAALEISSLEAGIKTVRSELEVVYSRQQLAGDVMGGVGVAGSIGAGAIAAGLESGNMWVAAAVALLALSSVLLAKCGIDKRMDTSRKLGRIDDVDVTLTDLKKIINTAQAASVAIYCSRVHQMPLETMSRRERDKILENFGIDVSALYIEDYNEALISASLENFLRGSEKFLDGMDKLMEDANVAISTKREEVKGQGSVLQLGFD